LTLALRSLGHSSRSSHIELGLLLELLWPLLILSRWLVYEVLHINRTYWPLLSRSSLDRVFKLYQARLVQITPTPLAAWPRRAWIWASIAQESALLIIELRWLTDVHHPADEGILVVELLVEHDPDDALGCALLG
jgi:hypothetical protein